MTLLAEFRMADLGIEPVMEDDGESYHYSLPEGLDTPELLVRGGLEYVYDGQQVYRPGAERVDEITYTRESSRLTDVSLDAETYLGVGETTMVDEYGRRWLLLNYDESTLWDQIDAYDSSVERTQGLESEPQERVGIAYDPGAGETETVILDTDLWIADDCTAVPGTSIVDHIYGGSTQGLTQTGDLNVRQKKIVMVIFVDSSNVQHYGSGVLVDDDTVLTAAHVVSDQYGYFDPVNMRVCSYGNMQAGAQCRTVSAVTTPGGTYNGTVDDDYAVVTLNSAYSPTLGWMAMSTASDATLASATHYHEGYPSHTLPCEWNDGVPIIQGYYLGINPVYGTGEWYNYFGIHQMTAYGPAKTVWPGAILFNVSGAGGMSGGPYYYCPSGCTETSGAHYITAVTTGHLYTSPTSGYSNGPRASAFRDWVIAHM